VVELGEFILLLLEHQEDQEVELDKAQQEKDVEQLIKDMLEETIILETLEQVVVEQEL
jgi:hypothetical protein